MRLPTPPIQDVSAASGATAPDLVVPTDMANQPGSLMCASAGTLALPPQGPGPPARFSPHRPHQEANTGDHTRSPYARWMRPTLGALLVAGMAAPVATLVAGLTVVQLATYRRWNEVFFLQTRAGQHGKPFRIVKFRTMQPDESGVPQPTRLGSLLRKSHLDELPQLWNVITGEMSLIGPRPETLELEAWGEKEVPGFQSRLTMRPGITGLAQVVQDSTPQVAELYEEKLRLNRLYQQTISLRTDAWILFRTAVRPIRPRVFDH